MSAESTQYKSLPSYKFTFLPPRTPRGISSPSYPSSLDNLSFGSSGNILNTLSGWLRGLGIDLPSLVKGFFAGQQKQGCAMSGLEKSALLEYVPFITTPVGAILGNAFAGTYVAPHAPTEEQKKKDILYGTMLGGIAGLSFGVALPLFANYVESLRAVPT